MYAYERGVRLDVSPRPPRPGGAFDRLRATGTPIVMDAFSPDDPIVPGTETPKSLVTVPIIARDKVIGSIHLENLDHENAYGEAEVRLLSTVASSMGVALESAPPVRRDQRLLKETEQRAAELAVINSIQQGMAAEARLPGDHRPRRRQAARGACRDDIVIVLFDEATTPELPVRVRARSTHVPAATPRRRRHLRDAFDKPPTARIDNRRGVEGLGGFTLSRHGADPVDARCPDHRQRPGARHDHSRGSESENAFGDSEVRLLQTVAASVGVALENARLFDETQRRTRESAALAEVGRDISSTLDLPR